MRTEQATAETAIVHLNTAIDLLKDLRQGRLADQVAEIREKVPLTKYEDGIYRLGSRVWVRKDGEWTSVETPNFVRDDWTLEEFYGKPVRVNELPEEYVAFRRGMLPKSETLRTLLADCRGTGLITSGERSRVERFAEFLQNAFDL